MAMQMKEIDAQTGVETIRNFTPEEVAASSPTEDSVRSLRAILIAETDWWALPDRTMTAEQIAYRQALRDITNQAGFPNNITWPQEPSA